MSGKTDRDGAAVIFGCIIHISDKTEKRKDVKYLEIG